MGRYKKEQPFLPYDETVLIEEIKSIEIKKSHGVVITSKNGKELKRVDVSKRYGVFDFRPFVIRAIKKISKQFKIDSYFLDITGGIQYLVLLSETVKIEEDEYYKAFYILNSTDRTRILNVDFGLFCKTKNLSFISKKSSFNKKHYTDIKEFVDSNIDLNASIFDEQIKIITKMYDKHIALSKIREIILNADKKTGDINKSNHLKFDLFRKKLMKIIKGDYTNAQSKILETPSIDMKITPETDLLFDAHDVFEQYLLLYSTRDSYVIKKESEVILKMTKEMIRKRGLENLLNATA